MIKKKIRDLILVFLITFFPQLAFTEIKELKISQNDINILIEEKIRSPFSYSGLAAFYNEVNAYVVDIDKINRLDDKNYHNLTPKQSLAIVGHHKIMIIYNLNTTISFVGGKITWQEGNDNSQKFNDINLQAQLLLKSDLANQSQLFQKLKYAYLWEPFRILCLTTEVILLWLHSLHSFGWGITIILLSLLFKIFILPANVFLLLAQRKVSYIQASLSSELENIKLNFSGEEAHNKFMTAHKTKGVSPFYNLKPLFLTLVPIPFLIAIFNVLGELDLIAGNSFLWIKDLAYPDAIIDVGVLIPLLGSSINFLPIFMTLITILGALFHQNKIINKKELKKQKLNLYFIAFVFFILFYSFPSAMVLYWTFASIWVVIQQKFVHI